MSDNARIRVTIVGVVVMALFGSLFARLWFLQVNESDTVVRTIARQTRKTIWTESPRGLILDATGKALVANELEWVITADPQMRALPKTDKVRRQVVHRLALLLHVPEKAVNAALDDKQRAPIEDAILATDVEANVRTVISERGEQFPHISVEPVAARNYPFGDAAVQVLGYVSRVYKEDLDHHPNEYGNNDTIGRTGIEAVYEAALRGERSSEVVVTNPAGLVVGDPVAETKGRPGHDVQLTVDLAVQQQAQASLAEGIAKAATEYNEDLLAAGYNVKLRPKGGAAVVIDTTNGDVVAMASNPSYTLGPANGVGNRYDLLSKDPSKPLINRATQGLYAPGSTFKLVTSVAMQQAGIRGVYEPFKDTTCYDSAFARSGSKPYCSPGGVGSVSLEKAIAVSADVYFYSVGDLLWGAWKHGVNTHDAAETARGETMQRVARAFGFGGLTHVDIDEASKPPGRVPDAAWRKAFTKALHDRGIEPYKSNLAGYDQWNPGDNIYLAVGQGDLVVTPLQLANAYATFANGGTRWRPRLVASIKDGTKVVRVVAPKREGGIAIDDTLRTIMMNGFRGAVADGTAKQAFSGFPLAQFPVAGKTGTAQVGLGAPDCINRKPNFEGCKGDTSVFVGMFGGTDPVNHPRYVVAVMVEEGGRGGRIAAPIARQIIEKMSGLPVTPIPDLGPGHD